MKTTWLCGSALIVSIVVNMLSAVAAEQKPDIIQLQRISPTNLGCAQSMINLLSPDRRDAHLLRSVLDGLSPEKLPLVLPALSFHNVRLQNGGATDEIAFLLPKRHGNLEAGIYIYSKNSVYFSAYATSRASIKDYLKSDSRQVTKSRTLLVKSYDNKQTSLTLERIHNVEAWGMLHDEIITAIKKATATLDNFGAGALGDASVVSLYNGLSEKDGLIGGCQQDDLFVNLALMRLMSGAGSFPTSVADQSEQKDALDMGYSESVEAEVIGNTNEAW